MKGVDLEGEEGNKLASSDSEFLMEVLEIREMIEESTDVQYLQQIARQYEARMRAMINDVARAFDTNDVEGAKILTIRLKYISRIQEEASNKAESLSSPSLNPSETVP